MMIWPRYTVKALAAIVLAILLSCDRKEKVTVKPAYDPVDLIGNWTTIPNGQPYLRWTLSEKIWSETFAKSENCEPVVPLQSRPYEVVDDTLAIDWGIPKQIQDNFYIIKSLTPTRMVLYRTYFKEEAIFEKCQ